MVSNRILNAMVFEVLFFDLFLSVSEGQYKIVFREEVSAFESTCAVVFKDGVQPKTTIRAVTKNPHQKHEYNVQSGTVVDRGVIMP